MSSYDLYDTININDYLFIEKSLSFSISTQFVVGARFFFSKLIL